MSINLFNEKIQVHSFKTNLHIMSELLIFCFYLLYCASQMLKVLVFNFAYCLWCSSCLLRKKLGYVWDVSVNYILLHLWSVYFLYMLLITEIANIIFCCSFSFHLFNIKFDHFGFHISIELRIKYLWLDVVSM